MFYEDNSLKYSDLFPQKMNLSGEKLAPIVEKILLLYSLKSKRLKRKAGHERSELTK